MPAQFGRVNSANVSQYITVLEPDPPIYGAKILSALSLGSKPLPQPLPRLFHYSTTTPYLGWVAVQRNAGEPFSAREFGDYKPFFGRMPVVGTIDSIFECTAILVSKYCRKSSSIIVFMIKVL